MWSAAVVLVLTGVAFVFHQQILQLLMGPAEGFAGIPNQKPIYTELTEFIGISMKVSLLTGLLAALPFILFQVVMFVAPGLTPGERRYLYALLPVSVLAFVVGAAFGYRILFPPAVRFLLGFGGDVADPYIRIGSYANLMLTLLFWMGSSSRCRWCSSSSPGWAWWTRRSWQDSGASPSSSPSSWEPSSLPPSTP